TLIKSRDLVPCSAVTLATSKFQGDGPTAHPSSQAGTSSTDRTHWHCYSIADPLSCSPPWLKAAAWSLEAWSSGWRHSACPRVLRLRVHYCALPFVYLSGFEDYCCSISCIFAAVLI